VATLNPARWRELEPLLDRALDLDPKQRAAWLDELAQASPELAAQLRELLDAEDRMSVPAALSNLQEPTLRGLQLGAYRLDRLLGQGGMGVVWLAQRCDGRFEGSAAIKLLHVASSTPRAQARFRREGSVLASLTHPGIAKLFDAGVSAAGQPYLVLEYVAGEPIDQFVASRRLGAQGVIRLYSQVLSAVEHAHANLIVHRDLTPSNILVNSEGVVKLLDFGIATLLDASADTERSPWSGDGQAFTPYYAAPEQIRGEAVTTATDIYALGALLYKLLSGRHPTCEGLQTRADCLRAILKQQPPPRLGLGDLDDVLQKALRAEPQERYASVSAFAQDLERTLHHVPVAARAPTVWYRSSKFIRRHRAGLTLGALTAAGLLVLSGVSLAKMNEAREQRDAASHERERADSVVEFQRMLLSTGGDATCSTRKLLDAGRTVLARQARSDDLDVRPRLLVQLAAGYSELYELGIQRDLLTQANALAEHGHGREVLPEVRCELADNLRLQGEYAAAWQALDAVEALVAASSDPRQRAACRVRRAVLGLETARGEESLTAASEALQLLEAAHQTHSLLYYSARDALAGALSAVGRQRDAVAAYEVTLEHMLQDGLTGSLPHKVARHNHALLLNEIGRTAEAESILREILPDFLGKNPSEMSSWQPLVHYAEVALYQGDVAAALANFNLIVEQGVREKSLYWEGRGLYGQARALIQRGELAAADDASRRLAEIIASYPHVLDTDDVTPNIAALNGMRAQHNGDAQTAYASYIEALRAGGFYESKRLNRMRPIAILAAEAAAQAGLLDEATKLAQEAARIARLDPLSETQSAYLGEAMLIEANVQLLKQEPAAARKSLEAAAVALRNGAGENHPRTRQAQHLLSSL
jgi:eukaryotic-like serine/threonine-protein kinase